MKPTVTTKIVSLSVYALCIIKLLRLVHIKHCSGTVVTHPLLPLLSTNTNEHDAKFLPRDRPSAVPEVQPRAVREVYLAVETRPRALLYLVFFFDGALSSILSSGKSNREKATSSRKTNVYRCLTCKRDRGYYSFLFN